MDFSKQKGNTMTEYKSDLLFGTLTGNGRVLCQDRGADDSGKGRV